MRTTGLARTCSLGSAAIAVLLSLVLARPGHAQGVSAQVSLRGVPLADALQLFVERTGESVAYDPGLVRGKIVFCVTAETGHEAWLRCMLDGTGLEFFRRGSGTYVIGPLLELPPSWGVISGRVVDRDTGAPLSGASVLLADAGRGTASDGSGRFALDRLLPGRYAVTVTYVGFAPWRDSLVVSPGGRTDVRALLDMQSMSVRPIVVEADRTGGDPWLAAAASTEFSPPEAVDRIVPTSTRLADRSGVSLSDVTADLVLQGGSAADVTLRLDGVPLFVPRSIAGFAGIFGATALDRITVYGAGADAAHGNSTGGIIDFRHALSGPPGLDLQIDPYAVSGRARFSLDPRIDGLVSVRHGLGPDLLPPALDRMLRAWSGPDPFLLAAPLRRYDLASADAIGYGSGRFVVADPSLAFDDVHGAIRYRPRPTVSWDASFHIGTRSVGGNREATREASDIAASDRPLFTTVDAYDWTTRMVQLRHERVMGSRTFVSGQVWSTSYSLDHDYRLADEVGYRFAQDAVSAPEFVGDAAMDASSDGNGVDAWGASVTLSHSRGRHSLTGGIEAGRTVSRFDLRMASVSGGSLVNRLVPDASAQTGIVAWDTTTVFEARHAQVSNRADQFLATMFASDLVSLGRLSLEPGLRVTARPERSTVYAEPRLRAAWSLPQTRFGAVTLTTAMGLYRQFVNQADVSSLNAGAFFPTTRIWLPIDASLRPPRSLNASVGATLRPSDALTLGVDSWVKDLRHVGLFAYNLDPSLLVDGARLDQSALITGGRGLDRGIAVSAGVERTRWSAHLRYERSTSWRQAPTLFGGRRVPTAGQAPHRWTASLDVAPSSAWDIGLRATADIGRTWAFRPVYYDYFGHDPSTSHHAGYDLSDPGAHRLPALVTLDATAAWAISLGRTRLQVRGEVRNLIDRTNELDRQLLWSGVQLEPVARFYPGRTAALALRVVW